MALSWESDEFLAVGDVTFRLIPDLPVGEMSLPRPAGGERATDFFLAKPRRLVERYIELLELLQPQHIFELGAFQGGSTALFAEVAKPQRLVAIDRTYGAVKRLENYVARRGLDDVVNVYGGVDQADRTRLAEIAAENFDGRGIDLVVDDCSHMYEETKASFNELFPRLRPGGIFFIEDWWWAHTPVGHEPAEGMYADQVPLTRLIFDAVLAIPGMPGLIDDLTVDLAGVKVRRGDALVDPDEFDIAACSNPRGRETLAPLPSGDDT